MGNKSPSVRSRVKGALDGAVAAGLEVARVQVRPDGEAVLILAKPTTDTTNVLPIETSEDLRQLV